MSSSYALDWFRDMLWAAVMAAAPAVVTVVLVGLIIAILQAATQVNDQAVAFGPKAIAMIVALSVSGHWMLERLTDFTRAAFAAMSTIAH